MKNTYESPKIEVIAIEAEHIYAVSAPSWDSEVLSYEDDDIY